MASTRVQFPIVRTGQWWQRVAGALCRRALSARCDDGFPSRGREARYEKKGRNVAGKCDVTARRAGEEKSRFSVPANDKRRESASELCFAFTLSDAESSRNSPERLDGTREDLPPSARLFDDKTGTRRARRVIARWVFPRDGGGGGPKIDRHGVVKQRSLLRAARALRASRLCWPTAFYVFAEGQVDGFGKTLT